MSEIPLKPYTFEEHRPHLTDGRWHHDCRYCHNRRVYGGTGLLTSKEQSKAWYASRKEANK